MGEKGGGRGGGRGSEGGRARPCTSFCVGWGRGGGRGRLYFVLWGFPPSNSLCGKGGGGVSSTSLCGEGKGTSLWGGGGGGGGVRGREGLLFLSMGSC